MTNDLKTSWRKKIENLFISVAYLNGIFATLAGILLVISGAIWGILWIWSHIPQYLE